MIPACLSDPSVPCLWDDTARPCPCAVHTCIVLLKGVL